MKTAAAKSLVNEAWDHDILTVISDYIRIPAKSPAFDPGWEKNGHLDAAVRLLEGWSRAQAIDGLQVEVVRLPGRTPLIFMEVPGDAPGCILLYGHLDKQPEMTGWTEGLGPWIPVLQKDRLYGRGGADDGYSTFAALTAIRALRAQGVPHARCVVVIEACEESGSFDLPHYIDHLKPRIGRPDLVICLDSGCGNYQQLWCTTSLRGIVGGTLEVSILEEGVHSGDASGIVPSSFRIARELLDRVDDAKTGRVRVPAFHVRIPRERTHQARVAAQVLKKAVISKFPFVKGARPVTSDPVQAILNRTWRPALAITGADGLPPIESAGNVLRPRTRLKLSLRIPPGVDAARAARTLGRILTEKPPYGARVRFSADSPANGWNAPPTAPWLATAVERASRTAFGKGPVWMGEGGTIPFMSMLGERFPRAQFLITGVLGPHSNAHGPNEFLHLPTAKRVTLAVASVIADFSAGRKA
jgi:acetylornithine deacetylase/succinyl-diaminopimelate desuccinylase-like protein